MCMYNIHVSSTGGTVVSSLNGILGVWEYIGFLEPQHTHKQDVLHNNTAQAMAIVVR